MSSFIDNLVSKTSIPVLEQLMQFAAARHQLLVNNIANADTPGYRVQDLSVSDFQQTLAKALANRDSNGGALVLRGRQVKTDPATGRLVTSPEAGASSEVTFHDGANRQIEKEMALLAENTLSYNIAAELLKGQFNALKSAIRQRTL